MYQNLVVGSVKDAGAQGADVVEHGVGVRGDVLKSNLHKRINNRRVELCQKTLQPPWSWLLMVLESPFRSISTTI